MSFRSKYIGQFSKAEVRLINTGGVIGRWEKGQLSEACLTNSCDRLTYRGGGTVELADEPRSPAQQVQGGARTINSVPEVKWEPSVPEVKWLTQSQRLNGKKGHQSCLPVRVFAIFRDVSRCKRCSAMSRNTYIFTRGTHIWKGRGCSWEILKNP